MDIYGLGPGDDIWSFVKGMGNGIASGANGTVQFITSDAWKADTWKATGNLLLGAAVMHNGNYGNLYAVDAVLGTNTAGAIESVGNKIDNAINTLKTGTPEQKGEVVGQAVYGVAEGVAFSKGAGLVADAMKGLKTTATVEKVVEKVKSPSFVVDQSGQAFPVPKGASGPTPVINQAGNQTGVAFTGGTGGANGQVSTMRIMNPTPARGNAPAYQNGYIKYENTSKQGVDPYSGKTLSNTQSHWEIKK